MIFTRLKPQTYMRLRLPWAAALLTGLRWRGMGCHGADDDARTGADDDDSTYGLAAVEPPACGGARHQLACVHAGGGAPRMRARGGASDQERAGAGLGDLFATRLGCYHDHGHVITTQTARPEQ